MSPCRFAQLIGVMYCLIGVIGTLAYSLLTSVLLFSFHVMIGIWAVLASQHIVSSIRFSRKVAVFLGLLALVELHLPLPTMFLSWPPVGSDVPIVHLTTALVAAYPAIIGRARWWKLIAGRR